MRGFLLVHKTPSDILKVSFLYALEPDARMNIAYMLRHSIREAGRNYPADAKVVLPRYDDAAKNLVSYLFPKKKGVLVWAGERME